MQLFLGGPTASGKSEVALHLAERLQARIISADPFQLFRELPILTAQPGWLSRRQHPHLLYGSLPVSEPLDLVRFLTLAQPLLKDPSPAIIVGGAGLPMRALLRGGLDPLPPSDPVLRRELESLPLEDLIKELRQCDPPSARAIDLRNPRRVIRTLEICRLSGRPASELRKSWPTTRPVLLRGAWLQWPRATLHTRIAERAHKMFQTGVVEEVAACRDQAGTSARQAIGFREMEALLDGSTTLDDCREALTQTTRQYAKRQETWFRKEPELMPVAVAAASDLPEVADQILAKLNPGSVPE